MREVRGFSDRMVALDVMRAIAVVMVVFFHVATRVDAASLDVLGRWFLRYGFLGVDIFFPLSGFLITSFLLERTGRSAIGEFFIRRLFRIAPLYMVAVTLFALAAVVTGTQAELLSRIWITYSFLTAWFAFTGGPDSVPFTITWSVSVEEFAYILFGLAALIARARFVALLFVLAVLPFLLRVWLYAEGYENIYYFPLARLDSIACGGLVAVAVRRSFSPYGLFAACSAGFVALRHIDAGPVSEAALFSAVTCATCTAIALCLRFLPGLRGGLWSAMARVGLYSYFIYLFHFFTIYGVFEVLDRMGLSLGFWSLSVVVMILTTLAAHFSFRYFEAPLIRYGRTLGSALRPEGDARAAAG